MKGRKQPTWVWLAIIGLVLVGTGTIDLSSLSTTAAVQSGDACSADVQPIAYATAEFVDPTSNNQVSQVSTTIIFAKTGSAVIYNTTTSATTTQSTTSVPCGMPLAVIAGDGGGTTYYYAAKDAGIVTKSTVDATGIRLVKSGSASLQMANDTALWASTIYLGNASITDPDTSVKMRVKVPTTAGAYFGDKGWAMCVRYNAANFTQVYPQGYVAKVSIPHVTAVGIRDTVACYEMPGLLVSAGADWEGSLYLNPAGTYTGANATTVDVVLVDKTSMLFNGQLVVGFDTSITDGLNTDAGIADVTTTSALTVKGNA